MNENELNLLHDSLSVAVANVLHESVNFLDGSLYFGEIEWGFKELVYQNFTQLKKIPTPPTTQDPANFDERADKFLSALPKMQDDLNAMIDDLNRLTIDSVILNNNIHKVSDDFMPSIDDAKDYINKTLIKVDELRAQYLANIAVITDNDWTYSRAYIDDMFEKCIHILNHYTKTETDNLLAKKANIDEVYTKANSYSKDEITGKITELQTAINSHLETFKQGIDTKIQTLYGLNQTISNLEKSLLSLISALDKSKAEKSEVYDRTTSDKRFLGINAKASDSDKLDGLDSSYFAVKGETYKKGEVDNKISALQTLVNNTSLTALQIRTPSQIKMTISGSTTRHNFNPPFPTKCIFVLAHFRVGGFDGESESYKIEIKTSGLAKDGFSGNFGATGWNVRYQQMYAFGY